jgi:KipI family sensor histidine kinase inhibitor
MTAPTIEWLGDQALLLRWGDVVDPAVNAQVHAMAARLGLTRPPWLLDIVPAYASLALFFDDAAFAAGEPQAVIRDWLAPFLDDAGEASDGGTPRCVDIPVCYGGDHGPDLHDVAASSGLDPDEVVRRHSGREYRVAMLGFSPGFPYLLGLDPSLAVARLATPRTGIPAGSVGIGGAQTGVYPDQSPGGWRLIGRTPLRLFDAGREPPARLLPGDRVRFVPIDAARFEALSRVDA